MRTVKKLINFENIFLARTKLITLKVEIPKIIRTVKK